MSEATPIETTKVRNTNLVPNGLDDGTSNGAIVSWCEANDVLCVVLPARSGKFSDGTYREAPFAQPEFFIPGFVVIDGYDAVQQAYANAGITQYNGIQDEIFKNMDAVDQAKIVGDRSAESDANAVLRELRENLKPLIKPLTQARDVTTKAVADRLKAAMDVTPRTIEEVETLHLAYLIDVCGATTETAKNSMVDSAVRQNETDHKNLVRRKISRIVRSSKSKQKDALTARLMALTEEMVNASGDGNMEAIQDLSSEMQDVKEQLLNISAS